MLKKIIKLFLVLTFIGSGYCLSQPVNTRNILIRETDGSPSGYLRELYVTNTTLTKNSSGNFTLDSGSGGAVEGTEVLSTGEGGGTKYLREDGDGTSSWQTPAGSGDLLADGTTPMTSDWDIGNFDITLKSLTGDGTIEGAALTEGGEAVYNSTETPGGELGGSWASPTIDDSVAVTGWTLTTPTLTTSLTTDSKTISEAEIGRLDALTGVIVTDATAVTDLEGTGLSIGAGVLNWAAASTDLSDTADLLYETELSNVTELNAQISETVLYGGALTNTKYCIANGTAGLIDCTAEGGAGGNSFSTWAVNSTDIIAGNSSSTMTLTPGDNVTFIANNTTKTITINATGGGGAETNSLETTITGIADTEIFVGNDSDNGNFVTMSGDATLANTGALTIVDDSHNHVIGNIDAFTVADLQTQTSDVSIFVNNGTAFGGEVSGTYGAIVLGHDALDDQYYDSESDLTTLLDNNYVDEGQVNSIDSDMYVDGSVDDVHLATDFISETELSNITELDTQIGITGTANTTTFLRGDGAWEIPAGGAATNSITTWAVNGTTMTVDSTSDTWNITAGANVTITGDNGTKVVTIDSSAGGGGGSARKGYHRLPIQQARVTGGFTTGNASISAINSTFALLLDNVTDESSVWSWDVPSDYTGNLTAHLSYSMVDATSGTVGLEIEVMAITDGDSTDVNTASFDTANIVADGTTVPGTVGYPDLVNITLTNADSLAANDRTIIRVMRNVDANDTAVGDCALDGFKLEYD